MFSPTEYLVSGLGIAAIGFLLGGKDVGKLFFAGVAMIIIFRAFLGFINWDGSNPPDQPWLEDYTPTKTEMKRLDDILYSGEITKKDADDYWRCRQHNVCVRRYAR